MSKEKLIETIKKGESETLEFKPSLSQTNEIIETISAFANKKGGMILVGVSSSGKILSIEVGKDTIERLTNKITQNIEPKAYPNISVEMINGKKIIVIEVKEAREKPVFAFGRAFKRVGKSSLRMSSEEVKVAILENRKVYWDEQICENAGIDDLDENKIKGFLKKAKFERRLEINPKISIKEALRKLNLLKNGKLTNAAVLLFSKSPQQVFLQSEVRCARFKGTKPLEFIDMKVFLGNLIDQREDALEFTKEHIKLHAKIVETERVERWEYPIEAIREALTNAICHRDYETSANVQVRIFDDRIEIWNPGKLPAGLTVEKLKGKHESILRNPLIGKCFFLVKYIEQWGTGTNRIVKECLNHGLPEPIFEETGTSFVVTIRKYKITEEITEKLNEREKKAIEYLKEHKKISRSEYATICNCSIRTAFNDLQDLLNKGLIKRGGKGRYTYYELS